MKGRKLVINLFVISLTAIIAITLFNHNLFSFKKVNAIVKNDSLINIGEDKLIDINKLKEEYRNDEITGVVSIVDTNLSAIFTQTTDNKKYLTTNIYNEKDIAGNPFLDYRVDLDESPVLLIYGHNSKTYNVPFKELDNYYDKDFYDKHPYIELITEKGLWRYKIFSVYVETSDWYYLNIDFDNKDDWLEHLIKLKRQSMYDTGENVDPDDKILILQTCSFKEEFEKYNKKYLLIIARRVD